jgi:hypothetical protein
MIASFRAVIERWRRRRVLEVGLADAIRHSESLSVHVTRKFRRSELRQVVANLHRLRTQIEQASTASEFEGIEKSIKRLLSRSDDIHGVDAATQRAILSAQTRAAETRRRASALPGDNFNRDVRRRRDSILDECKRVQRAGNLDAETTAEHQIEQKLKALEDLVDRAETVHKSLPTIAAEIHQLPRQHVALDIGTEEIYQDIDETLKQARADASRGDYGKAAQRLREVQSLKVNLLNRVDRRARWAREEINRWLDCSVVISAFPELRQFPNSLDGDSVERWYALRPAIERLVFEHATRQRASNVPVRRGSDFVLLSDSDPLTLPLQEANDAKRLELFLQKVSEHDE